MVRLLPSREKETSTQRRVPPGASLAAASSRDPPRVTSWDAQGQGRAAVVPSTDKDLPTQEDSQVAALLLEKEREAPKARTISPRTELPNQRDVPPERNQSQALGHEAPSREETSLFGEPPSREEERAKGDLEEADSAAPTMGAASFGEDNLKEEDEQRSREARPLLWEKEDESLPGDAALSMPAAKATLPAPSGGEGLGLRREADGLGSYKAEKPLQERAPSGPLQQERTEEDYRAPSEGLDQERVEHPVEETILLPRGARAAKGPLEGKGLPGVIEPVKPCQEGLFCDKEAVGFLPQESVRSEKSAKEDEVGDRGRASAQRSSLERWARRRVATKQLVVAPEPTRICFAPENHEEHVRLAIGSKDGAVVVYRIHPRTMRAEIHNRFVGHTGAITALFFISGGSELVTACTDASLIVWHVDSGSRLKVFDDSSPLLCAAPHPLDSDVLIVGTASQDLKVITMGGRVSQKAKMESQVRVLAFDYGSILFLGTESGTLHALGGTCLDISRGPSKRKRFDNGAIIAILCVPTRRGRPAYLSVNTSRSVEVVDYGLCNGSLTELAVRHHIQVASLYSPSCLAPEQGFLVFGSGEGSLYAGLLAENTKCRLGRTGRQAPIVAVAISPLGTVLASVDLKGYTTLWTEEAMGPSERQGNGEGDKPFPPDSLHWDWPLSRQEKKSRISLLERWMSDSDRRDSKREVAKLRKTIRRLTTGCNSERPLIAGRCPGEERSVNGCSKTTEANEAGLAGTPHSFYGSPPEALKEETPEGPSGEASKTLITEMGRFLPRRKEDLDQSVPPEEAPSEEIPSENEASRREESPREKGGLPPEVGRKVSLPVERRKNLHRDGEVPSGGVLLEGIPLEDLRLSPCGRHATSRSDGCQLAQS